MTDLNKERELCNQSFEKYWDDFCEAYGNGFDRSLAKFFFANAWGEAKAQAVLEQIADDIQSWIAVESIQAMELDGETFVVGANELAEFIEQLVKGESGAEG